MVVPKARQNFVLPCKWCVFEHTLLSALLFWFPFVTAQPKSVLFCAAQFLYNE